MNQRLGHTLRATVAVIAAMLLASGCAAETRYKVLTFFFTGVPAPGEDEAKAKEAEKPAEVARAKKRARRDFVQEPPFFVHGPYGAGECDKCHTVTASKPFRTGATEVARAADAGARPSIGPRLVLPVKELCLTCHSDKAFAVAQARGLWMHGPVADGGCVACHSPHRAARQYTLLGKNNVELCTGCHRKPDLRRTVAHQKNPEADCLGCHNAHFGRNAMMLRAEYDEWQIYQGGG